MTIEGEPLCTNMARVALGGGYDDDDDDAEDGVDRDPCGRDDADDMDGKTSSFLVAAPHLPSFAFYFLPLHPFGRLRRWRSPWTLDRDPSVGVSLSLKK